MSFKYIVSLQIWHPDKDPADIASPLERSPSRSWKVGEPRTGPTGMALGGVREESYCVFPIGTGDDGALADCLRVAISDLEGARPIIVELRATGGRLIFHVTWEVGERGEVFDVALLSSIADIGIDLGISPANAA
jgi:hypothetical protein